MLRVSRWQHQSIKSRAEPCATAQVTHLGNQLSSQWGTISFLSCILVHSQKLGNRGLVVKEQQHLLCFLQRLSELWDCISVEILSVSPTHPQTPGTKYTFDYYTSAVLQNVCHRCSLPMRELRPREVKIPSSRHPEPCGSWSLRLIPCLQLPS